MHVDAAWLIVIKKFFLILLNIELKIMLRRF